MFHCKKHYVWLALFVLLITCLVSCVGKDLDGEQEGQDVIRIQAPKAPPSIPIVPLTLEENYEIFWYQGMDEAFSRITNQEVDISIIPINSMAVLANREVDIRLGAVTTWGILYLVADEELSSPDWSSLSGKEIGVGARGFSPDLVFRSLAAWHGLDTTTDMELIYGSSPEIAQLLLAGNISYAVLPEPLLTSVLMRDSDLKIIFDLEKEWNEAFPETSGLPQSGLAISKHIADTNPEGIESFFQQYEENLAAYLSNGDIIGSLEEEYIGVPAEVIRQSLARSNIRFVRAPDAADAVERYLNVLHSLEPESVGGVVPQRDEHFYYAY